MPYKNKEDQLASQRRHYARNKEQRLELNKKQKQKLKDEVNEYKETHPCSDCGQFFPACVMDFDHLGDKIDNVSRLVDTRSFKKVRDEIAKCELVCANCHRLRTWDRLQKADFRG